MRLFFIILLSTIVHYAYSQTVINFKTNPYINAGNNTWDPHYFDNSGCGAQAKKFGPNPLPLNGHNVRVVGNTFTINPALNGLIMNVSGNQIGNYADGNSNSVLSIEYDFLPNKTYLIELNGVKEEGVWTDGYDRPLRYFKPVFWIQLDDSPEIVSNVINKCSGGGMSPVKRYVGRYSKLIADPSMVVEGKTYAVKFSPIEIKKAIKITYDPSPFDPDLSYDSEFKLFTVKITEVTYEEDPQTGDDEYNNIPRQKFKANEEFHIPRAIMRNTGGRADPRPQFSIDRLFIIKPADWSSDGGSGYSINFSIRQNFMINSIINLIMEYTSAGARNQNNLPFNYNNNIFTYEIVNNNLIVKCSDRPSMDLKFFLLHN